MIYYLILALVLGCAVMIPPEQQRNKNGLLIAVIAFIALVCGLRDMLGGYDNYIYGEIFDATASDLREGVNPFQTTAMNWQHSEKGYAMLNVAIAYLTQNRYIFLFIINAIFYVLLYYHLQRFTRYPFIALFIFLALYYFFTWVYLRQMLAVAVVTLAIPYAVDRKPLQFFGLVFLGVLFHSGVVMLAPFYFIAQKHFTKNQLVTLCILAFLLGLTPVGSVLVNMFGNPVSEQKSDATVEGMGGVRLAYILEAIFFSVIIFSRYEKLMLDKLGVGLMNVTFMFVLTLLAFSRFENGGRLTWCYLIAVSCLMPEIIVQAGKDTWVKYSTYAMMIWLYWRILFAWGFQLSPYKTFLTDGVREYDPIWEQFEYDHNYDDDKLYKL